MYITGIIHTFKAFFMYTDIITMYNYTWCTPLAFISPCWFPFASPFAPLSVPSYLLGTLLAVTGSVHLGLRLLVNWPPLTQPSPQPPPFQIPRTPITQRLTKTNSGTTQHLLSGTINMIVFNNFYQYFTVKIKNTVKVDRHNAYYGRQKKWRFSKISFFF